MGVFRAESWTVIEKRREKMRKQKERDQRRRYRESRRKARKRWGVPF